MAWSLHPASLLWRNHLFGMTREGAQLHNLSPHHHEIDPLMIRRTGRCHFTAPRRKYSNRGVVLCRSPSRVLCDGQPTNNDRGTSESGHSSPRSARTAKAIQQSRSSSLVLIPWSSASPSAGVQAMNVGSFHPVSVCLFQLIPCFALPAPEARQCLIVHFMFANL